MSDSDLLKYVMELDRKLKQGKLKLTPEKELLGAL